MIIIYIFQDLGSEDEDVSDLNGSLQVSDFPSVFPLNIIYLLILYRKLIPRGLNWNDSLKKVVLLSRYTLHDCMLDGLQY